MITHIYRERERERERERDLHTSIFPLSLSNIRPITPHHHTIIYPHTKTQLRRLVRESPSDLEAAVGALASTNPDLVRYVRMYVILVQSVWRMLLLLLRRREGLWMDGCWNSVGCCI